MTAINGLPGHVLLVHFLVVLVPLTALLEAVGDCVRRMASGAAGADGVANAHPRHRDPGVDANHY